MVKIEGAFSFAAPPERVWSRLLDPDALRSCIPGCTELTQTGPDTWTAGLSVGAGPVRGAYAGTVRLSDERPPETYRLEVEGRGRPGFVKGTALVKLTPEGEGTRVTVDAEGQVRGTVAAVGQRMLVGVARMLMTQFFECLRAGVAPAPEGGAPRSR